MGIASIEQAVDVLEFAFQPVLNIKTQNVYGYEALLRNYQKLGFESIFELFDYAYQHGILYELDLRLRKKAIDSFKDGFKKGLLLFYNLDTRVLEDKNYRKGVTKDYLKKLGIDSSQVVFEVSERFKINGNIVDIIQNYTKQGFKIAIDDFGVGNVCLESFYHIRPDIIKIDGFFVDNIINDVRKKTILDILVKMANSFGFSLIAEKVETLQQVYELDSMGINLVQGYFVEKPKMINTFQTNINLNIRLQRGQKNYKDDILKLSVKFKPLSLKDSTSKILDLIKDVNDLNYIPVVNSANIPVFVLNIRKILASMARSKFFLDLYIREDKKIEHMESYLEKPAILEVNDTFNLEKLTNIIVYNRNIVVLTENYRYIGMITYNDLLHFVHRKKVYEAVNLNPLTGLAGNLKIRDFIDDALSRDKDFVVIYFDFDNFKPFNDKYGFRVGDRVIQLFANILSVKLQNKDYFIGHIGGDDFFAGKVLENSDEVVTEVEKVVQQFKREVLSFYDKEDRENGYIVSKDREGNIKKFPLLSVSAAVLFIYKDRKHSLVFLDKIIAELKKSAKNSQNNISLASLM